MSKFIDSILNDLDNKENGSFEIKNIDGFAFLTVYKPGKNGKAVTRHEVVQRLKLFGIEKYDIAKVEVIVTNADGKDHQIAIWEGGNPIDGKVEIEISEDKLHAYITLHPAMHGGRILSKNDIIQQLNIYSIKFGVNEKLIDEIIENKKFFIKTEIATGILPTPSSNGYIKVIFEQSSKPDLKEDEQGKVNFKDLNIIKNTKKDALLAKKMEPQLGNKGKNVFGEEVLPVEPKEAEWKLGINCYLSEDKKELFSSIEGRPILERNGTIRVDEVCLLENVDYSTGNVDFPGTIIVEGTVADNFTLKTKGSLLIKKSVGRVFLYAERDIVLSGGVMGRNGGIIESKSDIYAKFVEQGNLKAGKNIFIEEASLHSELVAGDSIIIKGGRGELIGGEAIAGKKITVSKLGAVVETKTELVVGLPPEVLTELRKMKEEILSHEDVLKKVKQNILKLTDPRKEYDTEEKSMLARLYEVEKKYNGLLSNTKVQYETIISNYESDDDAYVEIEKSLFPKVLIHFGRGKTYASELKTFHSTCFIANNVDGIPVRNTGIKKKRE
jgi:hypothetical protein